VRPLRRCSRPGRGRWRSPRSSRRDASPRYFWICLGLPGIVPVPVVKLGLEPKI
jgi:hypothetical protein